MSKTKEVTDVLTLDLTAEERDHLDKIARRYGRMSAGACIRWLIAEKWEKMPEERNYAGSMMKVMDYGDTLTHTYSEGVER